MTTIRKTLATCLVTLVMLCCQAAEALNEQTPIQLTTAINHAKHSVQLAIYTFLNLSKYNAVTQTNQQPVVQAIANAKKRGVNITIIYNHFLPLTHDSAYRLHHAIEKKEQQWCQDQHITCYPSSSGFHHSHHKYMIIDEKHAYVMTGNLPWCRSSGPCAVNLSYHVQTPKSVAYLNTLFASDIRNSQHQSTDTPSPRHTPWLVSPVNTVQAITDLINHTKHQLDIMQPFLLTSNHIPHAILSALDHLLARHATVHLLTSISKSQHLNHALLNLSQRYANFHIHCTDGSPFVHAKVMIQDHKQVLLGSANWSYDSLYHNREVGLLIQARSDVQRIEKYFQMLFDDN